MYDLVIKGGRVIDGAGNPWFPGDVAVTKGIISAVGRVEERARETIDASGLVVSPGFIDAHSHGDIVLISEPEARIKIMQGITTEIVGQDGLGEAPLTDENVEMWRRYLSGLNGNPPIEWDWRSLGEYLDRVAGANPSVNVASLVGHGNIRLAAMGMENRKPTTAELGKMKKLLDQSLREGAIGLSTGLIYPPCVYSDTPELTELCKVTAAHRGVFVVHMRNEGDKLLDSIEEVVSIGRGSGVSVHISHFKTNGRANWGKSPQALASVEKAREEGIDVTFDQYPYTAGSTFLGSLLPPWAHEGGVDSLLKRLKDDETRKRLAAYLGGARGDEGSPNEWDKILITNVQTRGNKRFEGKYVSQVAAELNKSPAETVLDLVLEEENAATMATFTMDENDVRTIMRSPLGMVCTDGIVLGKPHPRAYGSFPRVAGHYVREGVLRLEDAVRKMTSYTAQTHGLTDRGVLRPGLAADITVFDPETIRDTATFENPIQHPKGVEYVIVNGVVTVENGNHNGGRAGRVLRRAHA
ncbi:MAG: D-aminoacylase [Candidatus Bathyarchaeota archaeon]|nr:D-aminoacylase [Candidatus Bathyarchaeota archaeon]